MHALQSHWHVLLSRGHLLEDAKFMCPRIRKDRQLDWNTDEEMGRMIFTGQNPNVVFQVTPDWLATTGFEDQQVVGARTIPPR